MLSKSVIRPDILNDYVFQKCDPAGHPAWISGRWIAGQTVGQILKQTEAN